VQAIAAHDLIAYDVIIVSVLERPAGTAKLLAESGVPTHKVLMLRPDWPAPQNGNGAKHGEHAPTGEGTP
jgi:hypothetical protein